MDAAAELPIAASPMTEHRRETDLLGNPRRAGRRAVGHPHAAGDRELPAGRPAGASPAGPCLRRGQAGRRADQSRTGPLGRRHVRRHRSRLPGDDRRPARRARRRRCPARRRGHLDQHERQRGAGQPGPATPRPAAGRLRDRQSARRHQPAPIDQRHLSHGPAGGGHLRPARPGTQSGRAAGGVSGEGEAVRRRGQDRPHRTAGRRAA